MKKVRLKDRAPLRVWDAYVPRFRIHAINLARMLTSPSKSLINLICFEKQTSEQTRNKQDTRYRTQLVF